MKQRLVVLAVLCLVSFLCGGAAAAEEVKRTCLMGREYYLYLPDNVNTADRYWLVVGVHGQGGNGQGAAGIADWINKGNVIVVGPSFPNPDYEWLGKQSDEQLVRLFQSLQKEYRLYPKMFLFGFSGGGSFVHRFAMKYPDLVIGCAAHSSGSWSGMINPKSAAIPFAVSCGELDTTKGRYENAKKFAKKLQDANFFFKARFWPGVGHTVSPGASYITEECFYLSTMGMFLNESQAVRQEIEAIKNLIDTAKFAEALARAAKLVQTKPPATKPAGAKPPETKPAEAKPADATLVKAVADPPGDSLPGLQENEYGWHENAPGHMVMMKMREFYLNEQSKSLIQYLEEIGTAKVAAIVKDKPADAIAQMEAIQKEFKASRKVYAAATAALVKLKKAPPSP